MPPRLVLQNTMRRLAASLALYLTFIGLFWLMGAMAARAVEISNTATLRYAVGTESRSLKSNTVTLKRLLAPAASSLTFLRQASVGSGQNFNMTPGQCRIGANNFQPIQSVQSPAGSTSGKTGLSLVSASSFNRSDQLYISVSDPNRNLDPEIAESLHVTIGTSNGDEEEYLLYETGPDTGYFLTAIVTTPDPPAPTRHDCVMSLTTGASINARYVDVHYPADETTSSALIDPAGTVFDSTTGQPIDGARITIVDAATGAPARIFGDDGQSLYPSTVISGASVTDAGGTTYPAIAGAFRFPLMTAGRYRLQIEPPEGWTTPSAVPAVQLAALENPAGGRFVIAEGSYGEVFTITGPEAYRLDIPADPLRGNMTLAKTASVATAEIGDMIHYTLTLENRANAVVSNVVVRDVLPQGLRYRNGSLRLNGVKVDAPAIAGDGRTLTIALPRLAGGSRTEISYVVTVGAATPNGQAVNVATAHIGDMAVSNAARVGVRIRAPLFTDAMTIIGRITEGDCTLPETARKGVANMRVLLDDGRYAITDSDGLYHFEGVRPGTHVVQLDRSMLPDDIQPIDCIMNSRSGGRSFSRFVEGDGGSLHRADFFVSRKKGAGKETKTRPQPVDDATAAGANIDWLRQPGDSTGWLFPTTDHNPRAPMTRAAIRHVKGQKLTLTVNGAPASPLAFDGTKSHPASRMAISIWRGLPLIEGRNRLVATLSDPAGTVVETLTRDIWYTNVAARAEILTERSILTADGKTRPVIALRLTDQQGHPVRAGTTGSYQLNAPYRPWSAVERQQQRQLAGLDRYDTTWQVEGDDGIAHIELVPTTQSGSVELSLTLGEERAERTQELRAWLQPGANKWVVVGFAAGTAGFNTLADNARALHNLKRNKKFLDGQTSFFARGRIKGKWLLTMAYDSDKPNDAAREKQLLGTIDPQRYYTIYGDGSEQGHGAASVRKLYLRLDRGQFYALFGDYETGLTQTELGRYSRTLNGLKSEYRGSVLSYNAFASDTAQRFMRDELQGNGLSGPYRLTRRDILINSDKVTIEVRDRLRSERVIASETLTRHIDYDIDYDTATLRFRRPILSRDSDLNPQWIVIDYETRGAAGKHLNGGGRVAAELAGGKLTLGATALREADDAGDSVLVASDATLRLSRDTEIRAELARSRTAGDNAEAWLAEVEHHGKHVDALLYARERAATFGLGQQNGSEAGTRKYGIDSRLKLGDRFSLLASGWREKQTDGPGRRTAADVRGEYDDGRNMLRGGLRFADDRVQSGDQVTSKLLTLGASRHFLDRKLTIEADAEKAMGGKNDSSDFPSRYRLGGSYALKPDVRLILTHEITDGDKVDSSTTRFGVDAVPWAGARLNSTLNQQAIREYGPRTFAAFGLTQSLLPGARWGLDAAFDSNVTMRGKVDAADLVDPDRPSANGGYLGGAELTEDFWAVSLGATYRAEHWSANSRVEYRNGSQGDRWGLTASLLRQTQAGIAMAAAVQAARVKQFDGAVATDAAIDMALAFRPLGSRLSALNKLSFRLENATAGTSGSLPLTRFGGNSDGRSRRIVNNLALNVASHDRDSNDFSIQRTQASLYWGAKYVFDTYDGEDYAGFTQIVGLEARHDLSEHVDVGANVAVRHGWTEKQVHYTAGISVGVSPMNNGWFSIGYNIAGFKDRDFGRERYTRSGPYVTLRMKFDELTGGLLPQ